MGKEQEFKRLKYIRALQRFHKSLVSYLGNNNELTKDGYDKKISNLKKLLDRVEEIQLYKGDFQELKKIVIRSIEYVNGDDDINDIKQDILYASNQLEKTKNNRKYKKEKHRSIKFDEWE